MSVCTSDSVAVTYPFSHVTGQVKKQLAYELDGKPVLNWYVHPGIRSY